MRGKQRKPSFERQDKALVLRLPYSLVADLEDALFPTLDRELEASTSAFIVDLSGVDFANSAGMGILVVLLQRAAKFGVSVTFAGARDQPRALFERLDFGRHARVCASVEEALAEL